MIALGTIAPPQKFTQQGVRYPENLEQMAGRWAVIIASKGQNHEQ
jgi:hypothetical protein